MSPKATISSPPQLKDGSGFFQRVDFLVRAAQWLITEALNTRYALEHVKIMVDQLQSELDANTAAGAASSAAISGAVAAVATEVAQLAAAIAAIPVGSVVTQAQHDQLNASTASLQAGTDALAAATASMAADDPAGG